RGLFSQAKPKMPRRIREPASRLRLLLRTFAGSRTHLQLARIGRTPERVPRMVFATQREALEAHSATCASYGAQRLGELLQLLCCGPAFRTESIEPCPRDLSRGYSPHPVVAECRREAFRQTVARGE